MGRFFFLFFKKREQCNYVGDGEGNKEGGSRKLCIIHANSNHLTRRCNAFKAKTVDERAQLVKDLGACSLCLTVTHKGSPCPRKSEWKCGESGCTESHSRLLHGTTVVGLVNHLQKLTCSITNEAFFGTVEAPYP